MRVIDAFAGIGGFSCAADALGWETVAFVERDPDCQFWLGAHWPGVPIYGDITTVRWEDAPACDIFTAGFPCQPHSLAGKRQASDDDRDLWSECVRAIGILRPRYAVLENVPGLLTSESGRFFNRVLSDLAALGYVGLYDVLSAAECGAPHRRERVWIVAYPAGARQAGRQDAGAGSDDAREGSRRLESERGGRGLGDADRGRCEQRDASERESAELGAGLASVGDADNTRPQGHGRPVELDGESGRDAQGRHGAAPGVRVRLPDWSDAIPYRGADGTVRLIPAGAVAQSNGRRLDREDIRDKQQGRAAAVGSSQEYGREGEEGVSRPQPSLRALVTRISRGLVGCDTTQTVEEEVDGTPVEFGGTGGSLWPVTESEPGRVARLRAVGNAAVPLWILEGPFRYVLTLEWGKDEADKIVREVRSRV